MFCNGFAKREIKRTLTKKRWMCLCTKDVLAKSNKTMADMQNPLLEETRSILRRLERGDATMVVSVAG